MLSLSVKGRTEKFHTNRSHRTRTAFEQNETPKGFIQTAFSQILSTIAAGERGGRRFNGQDVKLFTDFVDILSKGIFFLSLHQIIID